MTTKKINGLPVVNSRKSVRLIITPSDVTAGKLKAPRDCAAAIACRRQLRAKEAKVHLGRTYIRSNGEWIRFITPRALRDEIIAFDRGGKFHPGKFTLSGMQPSKRTGRRQGTHDVRRGRRTVHRNHVVMNVRPMGLEA